MARAACAALLAMSIAGRAMPAPQAALARPVSLYMADVPLQQMFDHLASLGQLNFVYDKDVQTGQKATMMVGQVSLEQALHYLLASHGLAHRFLDDSTILIYPDNATAHTHYRESVIRVFFPAYARAAQVAQHIKNIVKPMAVAGDDATNMVTMRGTEEAVRLAERLVASMDVPAPEVLFEIQILEVQRQRLRSLGIEWPTQAVLAALPAAAAQRLTLPDIRRRSLGLAIDGVALSASQSDSAMQVVATHQLRVRHGEKAQMMVGDKVPSISVISGGRGGESVTYQDVGLKLDAEPAIGAGNDIAVRLTLEWSRVVQLVQSRSGTTAPQIRSQTASTVLRLQDGEQQVLAGFSRGSGVADSRLLPGVGSAAPLKFLAGRHDDDHGDSELLIAITPHLVRQAARAGENEMAAGFGENLRALPKSVARQAAGAGWGALAEPGTVTSPAVARTQGVLELSEEDAAAARAPRHAMQAQPMTTLQWQGPEKVKAGTSFNVQLHIQPNEAVEALPLLLQFNPAVLEIKRVEEGNFLRQGDAATRYESSIDPSGQVSVMASRAAGTGASAAGVLVTLQVRALAPATPARINVLMVAPAGAGGKPLETAPPPSYAVEVTAD